MLIPVLIAVSFIVFSLMELAPGTVIDPMIVGEMTEEDIEALRIQFNLHRSMFYRYALYMLNLVQGDMGVSYINQLSVWDAYMSRLPNTLLLSFTALILGSLISIPMGIRAARHAGTITDNLTTTSTLIGLSMPQFWTGLLLLLAFAFHLEWLPAGGNDDGIRSLILPGICSAFVMTAVATRQTRSSMLEVLKSDYLRTARAKGVPEKVVIRSHALRNAMIPTVTSIGASFCVQLAGSAVIEQVFTWPGVGRLTIDAVIGRDVPMVLGCIILTSTMYVLVMLIIDILYAFLDPRIKSQYVNASKKARRSLSANKGISLGQPAPMPAIAGASGGMVAAATLELDAREDIDEDLDDAFLQEQIEIATIQRAKNAEAKAAAAEAAAVEAAAAAEIEITELEATSIKTVAKIKPSYATRRDDLLEDSSTGASVYSVYTEEMSVSRRYKKRNPFVEIIHSLSKNVGAMTGFVLFCLIFLTFIASLFISWDSILSTNVMNIHAPPSWQHPFGTDHLGRDLFLRTIYGTRYSLLIGFSTVGAALVVGASLGSYAAYFGGKLDEVIMRISDILASIPGLLLGMVLVSVLGQSLRNLIIAVGISYIPIFIRMSRASILTVRNQEFVEAARAVGLSKIRIIYTQVLPNGLSPLIVQVTVNLGHAILLAAALSFLGLGVPVPHPEWGALIAAGRAHILSAPWLMIFPGVFIMITVLALNLLGDGLRDALDPKMKRR